MTYCIDGFLDKNRQKITEDVLDVLKNSQSSMYQHTHTHTHTQKGRVGVESWPDACFVDMSLLLTSP